MEQQKIFVSVGATANEEQEAFVRAVEDRLRREELVPATVGRTTFSVDAPLKAVTKLMDECSGAVIIALERFYFAQGVEKRGGPQQATLKHVSLPTPWNQIEAAMAYSRGLPLLVIVEQGVRCGGLLEKGYDWYVQSVDLAAGSLNSNEFNGVFASWKQKIGTTVKKSKAATNLSELTVMDIVSNMKVSQLWATLTALAALLAGAFSLGAMLVGGGKPPTH